MNLRNLNMTCVFGLDYDKIGQIAVFVPVYKFRYFANSNTAIQILDDEFIENIYFQLAHHVLWATWKLLLTTPTKAPSPSR